MRKLVGTTTFILLGTAMAAPAGAQEIQAGMVFGPAFSNMTFDDPTGTLDPRIGATWGLYFVIGADGRFAIQPELVMTQKGLVFPAIDTEGNEFEATYSVGYLEVPILARVSYDAWAVRPFLLAGPVGAYRVTANYIADGYQDIDAKLATEKFDLGIAVGGGVELDVTGGTIQASLRYNQGLFDVEDTDGGASSTGLWLDDVDGVDAPGGGKHRSISLVFGFARIVNIF
ncbi:MAG TPA: porin family protein [Longimicrobiales bacterium]